MDIKDNIINLLKEDIECVHMYLDTLQIPRADQNGEQYSIVGRIKRLQESYVKEASDLETDYLSGQNTINSRNDFNADIIKEAEPIFDAYPQLTKLPVFAWGRYYKYESAGYGFEVYHDGYGFSNFINVLNYSKDIQWDLLQEIDDTHNIQGGKLWIGEWDIYVDREDAVKWYNFDDRGGMCLIVVKDSDNYRVECVSCDSPE